MVLQYGPMEELFGHVGGLQCFDRCDDDALLSELNGKLEVVLLLCRNEDLWPFVSVLLPASCMFAIGTRFFLDLPGVRLWGGGVGASATSSHSLTFSSSSSSVDVTSC